MVYQIWNTGIWAGPAGKCHGDQWMGVKTLFQVLGHILLRRPPGFTQVRIA